MDNAIRFGERSGELCHQINLEDGVAFAIEKLCAELIGGRANSINAFARLLIIGLLHIQPEIAAVQ